MSLTPEGKVKARVKEIFKAAGVWYCMPVGGMYGRAGIPDFLACANGWFIAVETKAKGKKPTRLQSMEQRNIEKAGGIVLVINPDNLHELEETVWNCMETSCSRATKG